MKSSRRVAVLGLLLALMFVLGMIENMLPPLPLLPPQVRLGMANVAAMYCIFFIGKKDAFILTFLKSMFIFMTRGPVAAALSLTGGILSVAVIILALVLSKNSLSYITYSILGAEFHNIGQIIAFSCLMKNWFVFYYLPVLLIAGVITGFLTGTLLKVIMPYFKRIVQDGYLV